MSTTEVYFSITREIDAPRADVFRAWVAQGHAASGYREVAIPRRLVFDLEPGVAIVTFAEHHGGTVVAFEGTAEEGDADAVETAWRAALDRLADQPAGSQSRGNAGGIRPG